MESKLEVDPYLDLRYSNIEYKSNNFTPNKKSSDDTTTDDDKNSRKIDNVFRVKYKTEICKFFELNNTCKFGNKV